MVYLCTDLLSTALCMQASEVAEKAAKSISDMQNVPEDSDSPKKEEEADETGTDKESEVENERRKAALDKLEKASEESLLGQASFGS